MDGGHGAVVTGVHGLQHLQHFRAAHLAHHNAIRAHAQAVAQQIPNGNHSRAFKATGTAFHAHHMRMRQRQLGRILNRHHPLIGGDKARNRIEHGGLAATGAATDKNIAALAHRQLEQAGHAFVHGAEIDQILNPQRIIAKLAYRHRRPVQRQGLYHHIDTPSIRQARIDHGRGFIEAATQR